MDPTQISAAVFPIYMQAGGVGKTTLTANLGALLARRGYRVLLIDFDINGYLTPALGLDPLPGGGGLCAALAAGPRWTGDPAGLIQVHQDGMHVIPVDDDRSMLDVMLSRERAREHRLTQFLARMNGSYDCILIDCQPHECIATDNALLSAANREPGRPSGPIIPVCSEAKSWLYLPKTLAHIRELAAAFGVRIDPVGTVISMYNGQAGKSHRQYAARFRQDSPVPVLATVQRRVATTNAEQTGRPIVALDPAAVVSGQFAEVLSAITGEGAA